MTAEDVDALLCVFSDPNVMASFGSALFGRAQMQGWVKRNLEHQNSYGYGLFSVIRKADGALIGDCGLSHMEIDGQPEVEIGYDLRSNCWNQGFATEAAGAVRNYATEYLKHKRLVSLVRLSNTASRRVAEKIGMTRERLVEQGGVAYGLYAFHA